MLTVEVVEEDEMKNNLGFLALETFPHYYPDSSDIFYLSTSASSAKERHENAKRNTQTEIIILEFIIH